MSELDHARIYELERQKLLAVMLMLQLTVASCSRTARPQRWPGDLLPVDGSRQRPRLLVRRQRQMARVRRLILLHLLKSIRFFSPDEASDLVID